MESFKTLRSLGNAAVIREKIRALMRNDLISRFSKVFTVDAILKASNVILLPIYLRLMSKTEFGTYSYFLSIVGVYASILNFGMFVSQGKMYHDFPEEKKGDLLFTVNVLLIGFLAVSIALITLTRLDVIASGYLFKHNPIDYSAYRWVLLAAAVSSIYSTMIISYYFHSIKIRTIQIFNISRLVIVSPLIILAIYLIPGDKAQVRFRALTLLELTLLACFSWPYVKSIRTRFDWAMARTALKIGLPTMLNSIIGVLYGFSDKFIIEKFYPMSEMSILNLALTICSIIPLIFSSFQGVWAPIFYKEKNPRIAFIKVGKACRLVAGIFGGLGLAMWVCYWLGLKLGIFKVDYASVLLVLPILLAASVLQCIVGLYANFIIYFEKTWLGIVASLFAAAMTMGMNILLIPKISYYGAALTSLSVSLITFLGYYLYAKKNCLILENENGLS